jgi:hypothetical protein
MGGVSGEEAPMEDGMGSHGQTGISHSLENSLRVTLISPTLPNDFTLGGNNSIQAA